MRTAPNKSLEPTATRRYVESPEMFIDRTLSFEATASGLCLSSIR
jgi:hypothetical protein